MLGEAQVRQNLGNVYTAVLDRWDEAEESLRRALTIWETYGRRIEPRSALNNLGRCYHLQGRYGDALAALGRAIAILHECGDCLFEGESLTNQAKVLEGCGDLRAALELGRRAVAVLEGVNDSNALAAARALRDPALGTGRPPVGRSGMVSCESPRRPACVGGGQGYDKPFEARRRVSISGRWVR